jgi:hypothetical protein
MPFAILEMPFASNPVPRARENSMIRESRQDGRSRCGRHQRQGWREPNPPGGSCPLSRACPDVSHMYGHRSPDRCTLAAAFCFWGRRQRRRFGVRGMHFVVFPVGVAGSHQRALLSGRISSDDGNLRGPSAIRSTPGQSLPEASASGWKRFRARKASSGAASRAVIF